MIKNTVIEKINHVKMPPVIDKDTAKFLEGELLKWMELPVQVHVFDFGQVLKLHNTIYGPMIKFKKELEKTKKAKVISVNFKPEVLIKLQGDGMDSAIGYLKNIAGVDAGKNKDSPADVKKWMVKYFADAARDGITTMFNIEVNITDSAGVPPTFSLERCYKISATEAATTNLKTRLRLYFEKACLEGLTKAATFSVDVDLGMVDSTALEIMNLIYGSAKSKMNNDRGYQLPPKIPHLITVAQADADRKGENGAAHWLALATPYGTAHLEICFFK